MKAIGSIVVLVLVLGVVGKLVSQQLAPRPASAVPANASVPANLPQGTPQQQIQQVKQAVDGLMQAPRPVDDAK